MDNENMLGATELPVDVSELGELCSAELECPGVYHLAVRSETDHCPFPMEYYLVLDSAHISKEAKKYGTPLENGQGFVFSLEQEGSGAKIIEYEIFKYRVLHNLPLPGNETLHGCAVYAAELYPEYFGMLPVPMLTPWGHTTRHRALASGIYWIETDQCVEVLAVSHPASFDCRLSAFTQLFLPGSSKSYYPSKEYSVISAKMAATYLNTVHKDFVFYENGIQDVDKLLSTVYKLAPTVNDFYTLKHFWDYSLLTRDTTTFEYFNSLVPVIVDKGLGNYIGFAQTELGDFRPITNFFISNHALNKRVFSAHSMAGYYSWLSSCTAEELFGDLNQRTSTTFKRIQIACPVNVYVYNESGTLVASVVDEAVVENILAVSIEDAVKTIDLPSDQIYSIEIVATDEGTVNYAVEEWSAQATGNSVLRTVTFNPIAIEAGDELTGEVNDVLYTDSDDYALTKNDEDTIYPDSDSLLPSYQITALANPSAGGRVWIQGGDSSSGTYEEGTSVTVVAQVNSGYRFIGWTVNGTMVSTDASYTFTVEADRTLTAVFERISVPTPSNPSYQITTSTATNGTVTVTPTSTKSGAKVTITATPDEGYTVDTISVTRANGGEIEVTDNGNGTYTFTMPASKVTVTATFVKSAYSVTVDNEIANGTIEVNKETAQEGDTITITSKANTGYISAAPTVKDENGNVVEVVKVTNGTWSFIMPKGDVTVTGSYITPAQMFSDVDDSKWYRNDLAFAVEHGLIEGYDGKFSPNDILNRGMMVRLLYNLEGKPDVPASNPFTDVPAGQWYTDAVAWAVANKIVEGYGNNTFGPDDDITREQMATILYRYVDYKGYDVSGLADLSSYTDQEKISSWALTAMRWANREDLITGRTTTTLVPDGASMRIEAAVLLAKYCRLVIGME